MAAMEMAVQEKSTTTIMAVIAATAAIITTVIITIITTATQTPMHINTITKATLVSCAMTLFNKKLHLRHYNKD